MNFRHLLERHDLTKAVFAAVAAHLEARGEMLGGDTIVDATLIAASPSTKNEAGRRDPEMTSSKSGNQWYFGMKAHIGVDAESGLVHTAGVTTSKVHDDAKVMDRLIREDDVAVYGDKGYANDAKKRAAEEAGVTWAVKEKAKPSPRTDAATAGAQSPFRQGARENRARVPRREVPVRLSQGALSRHCQERRAGVYAARARQSLSRPRPACARVKGRGARTPRVVASMPENPSHCDAGEPRLDRQAVIFRGSLKTSTVAGFSTHSISQHNCR